MYMDFPKIFLKCIICFSFALVIILKGENSSGDVRHQYHYQDCIKVNTLKKESCRKSKRKTTGVIKHTSYFYPYFYLSSFPHLSPPVTWQ